MFGLDWMEGDEEGEYYRIREIPVGIGICRGDWGVGEQWWGAGK